MAQEIPVTQARADFAELVNRVVYGDERIVVTRHGRPLVALVSAADLERLNELDALEAASGVGAISPGRLVRLTAPQMDEIEPARRFDVAARHGSQSGRASRGERR